MVSEDQARYQVTLRGHPWSLWGLSQLFDGTNSSHTRITAERPNGRPIYNHQDPEARQRFQVFGFDVFGKLYTDKLIFADRQLPTFDEVKAIAIDVVGRINGIALLIEPDFLPVSPYYISYSCRGGSGGADFGKFPQNRENTFLGAHPAQFPNSDFIFVEAESNGAVKFVLDALALPTTWASLYLIYDTIRDSVGGLTELKAQQWVSVQELDDFTYTANRTRQIREGARHGGVFVPPKPFISLSEGHWLVLQLARKWLWWLKDEQKTSVQGQ